MSEGCFRVDIHEAHIDELELSLLSTAPNPLPDDQRRVCEEVQTTQMYLHLIFPEPVNDGVLTDPYARYLKQLEYAARIGVTGAEVHTDLALSLIGKLQETVAVLEGEAVKNKHLRSLGYCVLFSTAFFAVLGGVIQIWLGDVPVVYLAWLLSASGPGVWVSYAVRKTDLTFIDIAIPEKDRLRHLPRLIFVGILTVVFALFLRSGAVAIQAGGFDPAKWDFDVMIAVLLGFSCGFSEQVLAGRVGKYVGKAMPGG